MTFNELPSDKNDDNTSYEIEPIESIELDVIDKEGFDQLLQSRRSVKIESGGIDGADRIGALIPETMNAVNAAKDYGRVIVKLPKDVHVKDLADSKIHPGWKTAFHRGDNGKIDFHGVLKQVKISPSMVATLAFQAAAIVVGQHYMAEIDKKLESIQKGIEAVQDFLEAKHRGDMKGIYRSLIEYAEQYEDYSDNPSKMQAALSAIENLRVSTNKIWETEVGLQETHINNLRGKSLDEDGIVDEFYELGKLESSALAAFQLRMTVEKISMRYDDDFSTKRIEMVKHKGEELAEQYRTLRNEARETLNGKIDELKGFPWALPDELPDDGFESDDPIENIAHETERFFEWVTHETPWDAAGRQLESKKEDLRVQNQIRNVVEEARASNQTTLDDLDFMYNKASMILIDEDGIRLIGADVKDDEPKDNEGEHDV